MYNPFSLSGKTILVTGASSGIGRATAIECAKMGATVILTARNEERLKETISQMDEAAHKIITADLTNEADRLNLCKQLPELDGAVFCAGTSLLKPIQVLSEKDITSVFATNYTAPVLLTKTLVKARILKRAASLVYIASISGNGNTAPALAIYGSSKSGLTAFVRYAAIELAGRDIRCNAICPGRIQTSLLQNQSMTAEDIQKDIDKYPLRRYGKPEEVAQAAVYLLSDATRWMTGTAMLLDGGRTLS